MNPSREMTYATPWERLAAYAIDILVVVALSITIRLAAGGSPEASSRDLIVLPALVSFVYFTTFMVNCQSTPGKLAFGLRITLPDGSAPEAMLLVLRYVVFFMTLLVPFASLISGGFIWFSADRQAIHDRVARTVGGRMPVPQK